MIYHLTIYYTIVKLCSLLQSLSAYEMPSNLYGLPNGKILLHPAVAPAPASANELINELSNPLTYSPVPDSEEVIALNPPTRMHIPMMKDSVEDLAVDSEQVEFSKLDALHKLQQDLLDEQDVVFKSAILIKLLGNPYLERLPIVYVEEDESDDEDDDEDVDDFVEADYNPFGTNNLHTQPSKIKRSRYYRRYPWKRHSRHRSKYEPELRYACTPTKEDVFKLLLNLHENRNGKNGKMITFCNRKRPARAIFTNIRFLG